MYNLKLFVNQVEYQKITRICNLLEKKKHVLTHTNFHVPGV